MSSHYREHVSFPNVTAGPYPPHLVAALDNVANTHQDDSNPKRCSVKGCSAPLNPDYPHKMCEECRGRHRVYAMTKRAKRKMEKALLNGSAQNGQPVAWMPPDDSAEAGEELPGQPPEPVAGPSRQFESPQVPMEEPNQPEYDFSQPWDANSIDPRLFAQLQSHTSELAGALILPPPPHHLANHEACSRDDHPPVHQPRPRSAASPPAPPPAPPAPEIHPVLAEVLKTVPGINLPTRVTSGPTVLPGPSDGPLPPRFCSIKGCKTLIAGNSFFKMCEPCRDRYRNYGTTKRAKWKREKEVAVAELHQIHDNEDVHRISEGMPPLPSPDNEQWQEYEHGEADSTIPSSAQLLSGSPGPSGAGEEGSSSTTALPPRMCTVSHCREILSGGYQFLRCERHRIQNRHHSKLKRVRDKEVKAQVYDGWAAAIAPRADGEHPADASSAPPVDADAVAAQEIAFTFSELGDQARDAMQPEYVTEAAAVDFIHETGTGISATLALLGDQPPGEDTPLGEPTTGLPPAARGTRRTNHVCSIKACSNLLSPSNPWKMCDLCRSRDRAGRRIKALRDSGLIPPEEAAAKIVEVRMEVEGKERRERKDKGTKKKYKGKKKKKGGEVEDGAREASDESLGPSHGEALDVAADESGSSGAGGEGGGDPQTSVFSSIPVPNHSHLVFMQPLFGQLAAHFAQASGSGVSSATGLNPQSGSPGFPDGGDPPSTNGPSASDPTDVPPPPKKRGKGKGKGKATQEETPSQSTDASISASQVPPPHYPPPNGHPYPYYMPSFMPPYGAPPGFPYGYPAPPPSPSKGGAFSPPAYQPPPYGAYPYPYPYTGHPYLYPGQPYPPPPGQSYSPPPAGQSYTPPPPYPLPPSGEQPPPQSYSHPIPQYPYAHPYPVPPPPPSHQSPTTEQPQQQPQQSNPPALEEASVSTQSSASTKRSKSSKNLTKAKGHSAKDSSPNKPAEVEEPAQKGATFIVRTSETYESPVTKGNRSSFSLKRPRDHDDSEDTSPNKRAEPEAPGTYSQFRISLNGTPIPTPPLPIPGTGVLNPSDFAPPTTAVENVTTAPAAMGAENSVSEKAQCSNKTCKRTLTSGTAGSLCERCRERLKKKQAKAKHRFKLEPKALLRRDLTATVTA